MEKQILHFLLTLLKKKKKNLKLKNKYNWPQTQSRESAGDEEGMKE